MVVQRIIGEFFLDALSDGGGRPQKRAKLLGGLGPPGEPLQLRGFG
jgi:hypothetical protein